MEGERPTRVVFDTMVYLQALASDRGAAYACLQRAYSGEPRLVVSRETLREIRDVLSRPAVRRKNPRITNAGRDGLISSLEARAELYEDVPRGFTYDRDPDDEPYLNLAIASGAAYLVTWDRDLLDLQNPQSVPGQELRRLAPQLAILDPVEFLRLVDPPASPQALPEGTDRGFASSA